MENSKASAGDPVWFICTALLMGLFALLYLELLLWLQVRDYNRSYPNIALHFFVELFWLKHMFVGMSFFASKRTGDVACWIGLMLLVFGFLVVNTAALACFLAKLN